jgi:hypothetical protein
MTANTNPDNGNGGATQMNRVTLHDRDGLHIWAEVTEQGALLISGQDLKPGLGWYEYEYAYTVPAEDLPLIRATGRDPERRRPRPSGRECRTIMPMKKDRLDAVGARAVSQWASVTGSAP